MGGAAALIPGIVGIAGGEYAGYKKRQQEAADDAGFMAGARQLATGGAGESINPILGRGSPQMADRNAIIGQMASTNPSIARAMVANELKRMGEPAPIRKLILFYDQVAKTKRSVPEGTPPGPNEIQIGESDALPKADPALTPDVQTYNAYLKAYGGDPILASQAMKRDAAIAGRAGESKGASVPAGYTMQPNGSLVPMVGGPADEKRKGQIAADRATIRTTTQSADRAITAIDDVYTNKDLSRVLGPFDARFPALTEKTGKIQGEIDNIKSRIVVDVMNALKAGSTNGSTGFGALSEKEMYVLQNAVAALNQVTTVDGFKEQLKTLKEFLNQTKTNLRQKYVEEYGSEFQDANQKMVDY